MRTLIPGKAIVLSLIAVTAFSQTVPKTKTVAASESFRLSMPKVEATLNAYTNLFEALAADPLLQQRWKAQKAALRIRAVVTR
jgi:hypothetical protein